MTLSEAASIAVKNGLAIYRKDKYPQCEIYLILTNSRAGIIYQSQNGTINKTWWSPLADDLTTNQWEVVTPDRYALTLNGLAIKAMAENASNALLYHEW